MRGTGRARPPDARPRWGLTAAAVALAYALVAPSLPELSPPEASTAVAGCVGVTLVVGIVTGLVAAADAPLALAPAVLGAALVVAALEAADAGAAATPFEVVLFGCLGVGFAVLFASPALAVALPLFVAALDVAGALAGGPDGLVTGTTTQGGDALALELPDWGTGLVAVRLGIADVVFLAAFATFARRGRVLREGASIAAMLAGLLIAVVAEALWDVSLPPLALLAAGYLLANADRLGALFAPAAGR